MCVAARRFQVRVIEGALHEFQVAGLAQELRCHVMPVIVKPEALDASATLQTTPSCFDTAHGQGVALAPYPALACPLGNVGESELGMMPAQRPQDQADSIGDWRRHEPPAFPC